MTHNLSVLGSAISTMPDITMKCLRVVELRVRGDTVATRAPEAIYAVEDSGGIQG
jgi:hypothetical protein